MSVAAVIWEGFMELAGLASLSPVHRWFARYWGLLGSASGMFMSFGDEFFVELSCLSPASVL